MRCKYENKILRVNSSMKIVKVLSAQLCLTPCYPMDYSTPGSTWGFPGKSARGFCHTLTCVSHGLTRVPHPEPRSRLPPQLLLPLQSCKVISLQLIKIIGEKKRVLEWGAIAFSRASS